MKTSYANVASTLALVLALGGTGAYAAGKVTGKDIKNSSVTGKDVKDGSLAGPDLAGGSVGADRLTPQVNAAIAAAPPERATPIDATVPDISRDNLQPIGSAGGVALFIGCGTSGTGQNVDAVELWAAQTTGLSYYDLAVFIDGTADAVERSSGHGSASGGRLMLTHLFQYASNRTTGLGTFVVIGGQVPMSGQVATTYDEATSSCRVTGWILHG